MTVTRLLVPPLAALLIAIPLGAQNVPVITLSRPVAEFPEPFSEIGSIRALSDGRVVVVDSRELTVQMLDFRTGAVQPIGRRGSGPGEYQWPQMLIPLPGDTTLLAGASGGRFLVIEKNGKAGALLDFNPPAAGEPGATVAMRFFPRFSDARGRLYTQASPVRRFTDGRPPELTDSAALERLDRATGRRDTVGFMPLRPDPTRRVSPRGGVSSAANRRPFPAWDAWTVGPDGRIAMVFYEPYRVDVIGANGVLVSGQPIPYQRVKVDDALKLQWRDERTKPQMMMTFNRASGTSSMQLTKMPFEEPAEWPDFLPPFLSNSVSIAPDGMVWVRRAVAAGAPPEYDVIDGRGRLVQKVRLPRRSHVVGFGNDVVYVVRMDEDDLQYLQRFSTASLVRQN